jgi:hypothetical protein
MEVYHRDSILQSPALQDLGHCVREHAQQWTQGTPDSEQFERELHTHVMALERELVAEELARYDVVAEQVEVEGVTYRQTLTSPETYVSAAGLVTVTRHLYRSAEFGSKCICPLEWRGGIIAGHFTPCAARQAAFVMAQLTPSESEALFAELGGMGPSRASLERLPKTLSPHWETHREAWETALRTQETVLPEATVMAVSVDGVMIPMKDGAAGRRAQQAEPGKHASGPTGHQEVGCGTVVLYDAEGERVQTVRYGRMLESKKVTLQQELQTEMASLVALRPDLRRVYLADGAKDNWRLLADQGADQVIRVLKYQRGRARGTQRKRLETELTYFRNQRPHMDYAEYVRHGLPIASGVVEAACKTLVTQRLKRSGMAWRPLGGQAILTLRSLIQSDRWPAAWALLSAEFRKSVGVPQPSRVVESSSHTEFGGLPAAAMLPQLVVRSVSLLT